MPYSHAIVINVTKYHRAIVERDPFAEFVAALINLGRNQVNASPHVIKTVRNK